MANVKQVMYNTRLVSEKDLPRTHRELTDPRYKGKFAQPPWTAHWDIGLAAFDKLDRKEWLDVVRRAGRNTGAVLPEAAAMHRVVLGEFAFSLNQDTHFREALAKDPKAPIAYRFFDDYNGFTRFYYSVRSRARSPAAGTLFALWMTSAEAQAIWQAREFQAVPYGESRIDKEFRGSIEKAGASVISFFDDDRRVKVLHWYRTEEGIKYLDAMARAIRGE
jgi:ABC-type Fe3+ transport system substrate-binding protein